MADTPTIPNALSAEEWASVIRRMEEGRRDYNPVWADYGGCLHVGVLSDSIDVDGRLHAQAAACLYGQPFGFTAEDVAALREATIDLGKYAHYDLDGLADRIAALLPPEAP